MEISTIAVIGAGRLGQRLASLFSGAGYRTVLEDVLPSRLRKIANNGGADNDRLRFASSVDEAVREADLVIDCVPDELESKLEIFSMADRMAPPRSILLTPTRSQSITDLAACTYRPERCLSVEFPDTFLEERAGEIRLVRTNFTDPAVMNAVAGLWEACGFDVTTVTDPVTSQAAARP